MDVLFSLGGRLAVSAAQCCLPKRTMFVVLQHYKVIPRGGVGGANDIGYYCWLRYGRNNDMGYCLDCLI